MSQSRLIPLTYYDPGKEVRLTVYADTIILDRSGEGSVISAVRFGGYPEMVKAMSDAIYGGATIEIPQSGKTRQLKSDPQAVPAADVPRRPVRGGYSHGERRPPGR